MTADPSDVTAQVAFSLKTRKPVSAAVSTSQDAAPGTGDVVGEDELLTDADRRSKTKAAKEADCTTRRRACKNCVCGRAEVEAKLLAEGKALPDDDAPPVGGCGGCSKGDAFRCATCPYRGTPAWTATTTTAGAVQLSVADDI